MTNDYVEWSVGAYLIYSLVVTDMNHWQYQENIFLHKYCND